MSEVCPRCGGKEFWEIDCGPDSYEDDISYTSSICKKCGLWFDGWENQWLIHKDGSNVEGWRETNDDDIVEFQTNKSKPAELKP